MRKKIAFIGAGSFGFTRQLIRDIFTWPELQDCELALMDIDPERLKYIEASVRHIIEAGKFPAKLSVTVDREEALKDADAVVVSILVGGVKAFRPDIEIPKKYGVDICVGDTRGASGIFRFMRTLPVMLAICEDVRRLCPGALVLNYTNPMAMLCRAMQTRFPDIAICGLCHSVPYTLQMLARWVGIPVGEIDFRCAGINHQAFFLELRHHGADIYPQIRKAVLENAEFYAEEPVRNEMLLALGYYVTETSGHNSEYNGWFRKRPDLISRYCVYGSEKQYGINGFVVRQYDLRQDTWKRDIEKYLAEPVEMTRSVEYASGILDAVLGSHQLYEFNGNVRNTALIDNLPDGCCVEVPIVASRRGLSPIGVGKLPSPLALLNGVSAQCEEMAIEGYFASDVQRIYQAVIFDPLTQAVLTLSEIRDMVNEMLTANPDIAEHFGNRMVRPGN